MKLTLKLSASVLLLGALTALPAADLPAAPAAPAAVTAPARKFADAELLEMLGWLAGNSTKLNQFNFTETELVAVNKGFASAVAGKEAPYKQDEIEEQFTKYMNAKVEVAQKAADEKQSAQGKVNKEAGDKFLAGIKDKKGVTALPSGLLFEILTPGKGASPKPTDTVRVNYTGTLIDGTVFDATSKHSPAEPSEFPLDGVIAGWTEGLQKINKGGKIRLYVPRQPRLWRTGPPAGHSAQLHPRV